MIMLNEREKRRPDFAGGVPVAMADGQEWHVAKPLVRFGYDAGPDGFRVCLGLDGDDPLAATAARLEEALEAKDSKEIIRGQLAIGALLLRRNYDLTDGELGQLLVYSYDGEDDPEPYERRLAILAIARGDAPKRRGDTSD